MLFFLDRGKVKPEEQTIKVGAHADFKCLSHGEVSWNYDGGILPMNSKIMSEGYMLRIRDVRYRNQGYYECEGITDEREPFISRGLLKVLGKIIILILEY